MNKIVKYWGLVVVWAGVIFLFSNSTGGGGAIPVPDYMLHIVVFGILALLLYRAFLGSGVSKIISITLALFLSFIYGLSDEIHQSFVPGRDSTINDVAFDTIGAIAVLIIVWTLLPRVPMRLKNWGRRLGIY